MRIRSSLLLVTALILGACQLQTVTQPTGKRASTDRLNAKSTPNPVATDPTASELPASPAPSPAGSASPSPMPTIAPSASAPPAVPTTLLKGLVRIDAGYVIAAGGGNIIATGGGNIIATGGGNFISTNSGSFVSTNSGGVIATGGGNVIAVGGGNVIAVGGGNIIATGGGNFRLLADALTLPAGGLLPVKGMAVVPVSLVSREIVGPPVLTGETGEYAIAVPQALKENILMVALWPGKAADDPLMQDKRLQYELIVSSSDTASQALDEDSALVSRYIRESFESKFAYFLKPKSATGGKAPDLALPPFLQTLIDGLHGEYFAEFEKAGIAEDEQKLAEAASRVARTVLSHPHFKLADIKLNPTMPDSQGLSPDPVVPLLIDLMGDVRRSAGTLLAADDTAFDAKPYVTGAKTRGPAGQPVQILKASDVCDFLVKEYLGGDQLVYQKIGPLWTDLSLDDTSKRQLYASGQAIGLAMFQTIMTDPEVKQATLAAIREYAASPASPAPSLSPGPSPSASTSP